MIIGRLLGIRCTRPLDLQLEALQKSFIHVLGFSYIPKTCIHKNLGTWWLNELIILCFLLFDRSKICLIDRELNFSIDRQVVEELKLELFLQKLGSSLDFNNTLLILLQNRLLIFMICQPKT